MIWWLSIIKNSLPNRHLRSLWHLRLRLMACMMRRWPRLCRRWECFLTLLPRCHHVRVGMKRSREHDSSLPALQANLGSTSGLRCENVLSLSGSSSIEVIEVGLIFWSGGFQKGQKKTEMIDISWGESRLDGTNPMYGLRSAICLHMPLSNQFMGVALSTLTLVRYFGEAPRLWRRNRLACDGGSGSSGTWMKQVRTSTEKDMAARNVCMQLERVACA